MLPAFFDGLKIRRSQPTAAHHAAKSRRPLLEQMEERRLLSGNPYMLIDSAHRTEGTGGQSAMTFKVWLSSPATKKITVDYDTVNRSAKAGSDYRATDGQLTFAPGESVKTVKVPIVGDSVVESTEAFYLTLSKAKNARIIKSIGVGSIMDDDAAIDPKLAINDVSIRRGYNGQKTLKFTVSLNTELDKAVSVKVKTMAITAQAGVDFAAKSQTLTFKPGVKTMTFSVTVYGTSKLTADKVLFVTLSDGDVPFSKATGGGVIKYGG